MTDKISYETEDCGLNAVSTLSARNRSLIKTQTAFGDGGVVSIDEPYFANDT